MRNLPRLLLFILSPFVFCSAFAQIETDRPDFTESPNVVPHNALQIESGFVLNRTVEGFCGIKESGTNFIANTTLLRYGILPNSELRMNWQYNQNAIESKQQPILLNCVDHPDDHLNDTMIKQKGFAPLFVGFKTNLFKSDRISIGFLGHLYLPFTASKEFEVRNYGSAFLLPVAVKVHDRLTIATQISMHWDGNSSNSITGYTLSLGTSLSDKLGFFVEPYGYLKENHPEEHHINSGFTYLLKDNLQVDLTAGTQLYSKRNNAFASCGVSYLINR